MSDSASNLQQATEVPSQFASTNALDSITELLDAVKELAASYVPASEANTDDSFSDFAIFSQSESDSKEVVAKRLEVTLMREVLAAVESAGHSQAVDVNFLQDRLADIAADTSNHVAGTLDGSSHQGLKLAQSA